MTKFLFPILLLTTATPALTQPAEPVTSLVRTADLDLSSAAGQRTLDRRLSQAIVEVCGDASPADLAGQNKVRSCRADAHQRLATERDQRIASASSSPIQVAAR